MTETVFANARVVLADEVVQGNVVVGDGSIAEVATGRAVAPGAVDLEGDYLLPGLVELHTDNVERHMLPRPGVNWPTFSAIVAHDSQLAASGITTVLDALYVGWDTGREWRRDILPRAIAALREAQAGGVLRAEHHLHLRCEVAHADAFELFQPHADDPLVRLVSLMDHTPGQRQFVSLDKYRQYYQGTFRMSDAEMDAMIAERVAEQGVHADRNRAAIADACHARGVPVASHDDATATHVAESARFGVTLAEFPTTLEAAGAARAQGIRTIGGAPNVVLGGSHSGNVAVADLARAGMLDVLSSDYVPASLIQAAFRLAGEGIVALPEAVAMISRTPAAAVGLDDRGEIAPGRRADLVRVREAAGTAVVREVWRAGIRIA